MKRRVTGTGFARAGLLGNPSDAYGGKAIAASIGDFAARVVIEDADALRIEGGGLDCGPGLRADDLAAALARLDREGCEGPGRLLRATLRRFALHCATRPDDPLRRPERGYPRARFRISFTSDVPFQVGLAGSSAIAIAALRALAAWFEIELAPFDQAELALAAEVEELGIAAGPMDRVVQAYEGVVAMDFGGPEPRGPERYTHLDPDCLPPLFVAWDPRGGAPSGSVHADIRARWRAGDPDVHAALAIFPRLVDEGLACLAVRDHEAFRRLVDRNFDARAALFPIDERDRALVHTGRSHGAGVKLCGSGGAVVGVLAQASDWLALAGAYHRAGFPVLRPRIEPAGHGRGSRGARASEAR